MTGSQFLIHVSDRATTARYDVRMEAQTSTTPACLACGTDSKSIPLIRLEYLDSAYYICPQHLPLLIHDPGRLSGLLPGAERFQASEHHD